MRLRPPPLHRLCNVGPPAGQKQVTPIPRGRRYSASDSVNATTAAFVAVYGNRSKAYGKRPAVDPVVTTWPLPCSRSDGRNARTTRTVPSKLTSMIDDH